MHTPDLFGDQNELPARVSLHIDQALSKDQKAFNSLIKKIEAKRKILADWENALPQFHQEFAKCMVPLREQALIQHVQLVEAFDAACELKGLTKPERKKLSLLITDLARDMLENTPHEGLKALYNKHSQSDFDAEEAAEQQDRKALFEGLFGVELDDDAELRSQEAFAEHVAEKLFAQQEAAAARAAQRKKTAKQIAREQEKAEEASTLSQTIREVYRKLASALHPDREPDPAERTRKTQLMQRANAAYEAGKLLQLLELQLELEHIDQAHLASLSEARLKHYLKILRGQLKDLEQEIFMIEEDMSMAFNFDPFARYTPATLMPWLQSQVQQGKQVLQDLALQIEAARDVVQLKQMLKSVKIARASRVNRYDDMAF